MVAVFTSCKNNPEVSKQNKEENSEVNRKLPTADNSRNALDWNGTYKSILPCADCVGIETQITLNHDLTYIKTEKYLGRSDSLFTSQGHFKWNDAGSKISLVDNASKQYQVGENKLFALDQKGERITGNLENQYVLNKLSKNNQWLETYWKLVEIEGNPVDNQSLQNEAYLVFNVEDSLVAGSGGCNRLSGSFSLKGNNTIEISQMRSTMMACENMSVEETLNQFLQDVNQYEFNDDTLVLLGNNQNTKLTFSK